MFWGHKPALHQHKEIAKVTYVLYSLVCLLLLLSLLNSEMGLVLKVTIRSVSAISQLLLKVSEMEPVAWLIV